MALDCRCGVIASGRCNKCNEPCCNSCNSHGGPCNRCQAAQRQGEIDKVRGFLSRPDRDAEFSRRFAAYDRPDLTVWSYGDLLVMGEPSLTRHFPQAKKLGRALVLSSSDEYGDGYDRYLVEFVMWICERGGQGLSYPVAPEILSREERYDEMARSVGLTRGHAPKRPGRDDYALIQPTYRMNGRQKRMYHKLQKADAWHKRSRPTAGGAAGVRRIMDLSGSLSDDDAVTAHRHLRNFWAAA